MDTRCKRPNDTPSARARRRAYKAVQKLDKKPRERRKKLPPFLFWMAPIMVWYERTMGELAEGPITHGTRHMHHMRAAHWEERLQAWRNLIEARAMEAA